MVNADNRGDDATRKVTELCRWDRVMYGADFSSLAQGQYLLGRIALGQYAQWNPEALASAGAPPGTIILANMVQANFIDGYFNQEPQRWCASAAEAEEFVTGEAAKLFRTLAVKMVDGDMDALA